MAIYAQGIGIGLQGSGQPGMLADLARGIEFVRGMGFRLVEIDPNPFHLIVDGQIHRPSLANWRSVLNQFDLRYSIHGLMRLNLAYDPRHELCREIMAAQIEICRAVGARTLVYHSGLQALDAVRYGVRRSLLSEEELAEGARREVDAFRELALLAADAGVTIGMENGDTHQWEHEVIARFGLPRAALSRHHARLHIGPIVRQLQEIDHPNVGLTLDVGHLYIAACDMGFAYLPAVSEAAPWVVHLHISDNFGRLDRGFDTEHDRWAFGEADIHMPPGWGSLPLAATLKRLDGFSGDMILEIKPGFIEQSGEGLARVEALIGGDEESPGEGPR
jgi:sugar phosphate isomerase/epimerase